MRRAEATGECNQQLSRRESGVQHLFLLQLHSELLFIFFPLRATSRMRLDKNLYY